MPREAPSLDWPPGIPARRDHGDLVIAAELILAQRLWCALEVCVDVGRQLWEPRIVIFRRDGEGVADAVEEWLWEAPDHDVRMIGRRRSDLQPVSGAPACLCYLAAVVAAPVTTDARR